MTAVDLPPGASLDRALIDRVETAAYTIPTDQPEADGTLEWSSTTMVTAHVTADGCTGFGWTYAPAATAAFIDEKLADVVAGRPARDVAGTWQALTRAVRNAGRPGVAGCAISALDVALWDLRARLRGVPLTEDLGSVRDAVPVYGSGGFTSYDADRLNAQLLGWTTQGLRQVKIKIGESWGERTDRDLARVRQVREVVGPDVRIFVDANGGYSRDQALHVGRVLDDHGVSWFEEPVSSDDRAGLAALRTALAADVTAGEYVYRLADAELLCEGPAGRPVVDCLQIDATRCGGYTEWRRIADLAAAHGLEVSAHCAPTLHAPVAAATENLRHCEWFHDHVRIEQLLLDGAATTADGVTRPHHDRPGHGVALREEAAAYRVQTATPGDG